MPKTTSTPTRSRAITRACAPVTRTGTGFAWLGRGAAAGCCAPAGCAGPVDGTAGCAAAAGRGDAGLAAAVLAGISSGDGACALVGTGLLCSVIGWLPFQDVRGCYLAGAAPVPRRGIKKPLVPGGSRGARAGTGLVSSLRASQVRECGSASRVPPSPTSRPLVKLSRSRSQHPRRAGLQAAGTPGFAVPLTSGDAAPTPGAVPVSPAPVLMRASMLGAAIGLATR